MHDRTKWTRGSTGPTTNSGKNLVQFSRPCAACNQPFSVYVTEKIASGKADSNAFGLRNCLAHRRPMRRKGEPAPVTDAQVDALVSKDRIMTAELEGMYEEIKLLKAENDKLKEKTKKYPWEA